MVCGNDVMVCGNDVMVCGNDVMVCGNDVMVCGNDGWEGLRSGGSPLWQRQWGPEYRLATAALADFVGMRDAPYGGRRFRPWGIRAVVL